MDHFHVLRLVGLEVWRSDTGDVDFIWSDDVLADAVVARAYLEVTTPWKGRAISALAIFAGLAAVVLSFRWGIGPWGRRWSRSRQRLGAA